MFDVWIGCLLNIDNVYVETKMIILLRLQCLFMLIEVKYYDVCYVIWGEIYCHFDYLSELGIQLSKFEGLWVFLFLIFDLFWKSAMVFVAAVVKFLSLRIIQHWAQASFLSLCFEIPNCLNLGIWGQEYSFSTVTQIVECSFMHVFDCGNSSVSVHECSSSEKEDTIVLILSQVPCGNQELTCRFWLIFYEDNIWYL